MIRPTQPSRTPTVRRVVAATVGAAAAVALATVGLGAHPAAAHASPAPRFASGVVAGHRHVDPRLVTPHTARKHGGKVANDQSENWSGYIQSGSGISNSTASWTVPTLSTQYNGYSSTWVGIDGASSGDQYLIQTGTEADVVDGQTQYDAWWEVITPTDEAPETLYSNFSVSPGDSISASVAKGSNGRWTMSLTDNSTGRSASHSSAFAGPGDSAEWIQEDTDVNGDISAAPDWHSVTFSGVTVDGSPADLSGDDAVDIVDSQGTQEDSTGAPNGDGFTVTWLAPGTATPTG